MNRLSDAIKQLFPDDFEELVPSKRPWWQKIDFEMLMSGWRVWVFSLAVAIFVLAGIYYWNQFAVLETNTITAQHQIEMHLQRRKDLIINLTRTVIDYADHERQVFTYMADKRVNLKENPSEEKLAAFLEQNKTPDISKVSGDKLENLLSNFMALAESYPQLKLSENFQTLMNALINIEDKIVEQRMAYNQFCNLYGTYKMQFPQCIYAFFFMKKDYDYIKADKDVRLFNRVEY